MQNPKVIILSGYGINSEEETKFAFDQAGGITDIVHINDLIDGDKKLADYQIMCIPGGFSYGDDTGSGNAYAQKLKNHLWEDILAFIKRDTLVLGICNGCQILSLLGLIPALAKKYGTVECAFRYNCSAHLECRYIDVRSISQKCAFTKDIAYLHMPIAHGEGNFYAPDDVLEALQSNDQIVFRYAKPDGHFADGEMPYNPNGSLLDVAAVCDPTGRIMGMMPHPERILYFTNHDLWTLEKEKLKREGKPLYEEGEGMKIFRNAVEWFR